MGSIVESTFLAYIKEGNATMVRDYVDSGGDVHSVDPSTRCTPLHICISSLTCPPAQGREIEQRMDIIRLLLERGADINALDANGRTPAFDVRSPQLAAFLADECGVDFKALRSRGGQTPLFYSTSQMTQFFLDRGLDVNARDKAGRTSLHLNGHASEALLRAGAALEATDSAGLRPIHSACEQACFQRIRTFMQWGVDLTGPVPERCRFSSLEDALASILLMNLWELIQCKEPLPAGTAWLKWLVTSPVAASALPSRMQEARRQFETENPSIALPTRAELLAELENDAWERRKHLVHCYFERRRLMNEARDKPPSGAPTTAEVAGSASSRPAE